MYTHQGIAFDNWVKVEEDCSLRCEVIGGDAQFYFGHMAGTLNLVADERALSKLVVVATEALTRLQAIPVGEVIDFVVEDPVQGSAA